MLDISLSVVSEDMVGEHQDNLRYDVPSFHCLAALITVYFCLKENSAFITLTVSGLKSEQGGFVVSFYRQL